MSSFSFNFPDLNKKDHEILFELDRDARQSNSKLADKIGIDKNVVNYRINRLMEKNIIRGFYTVINSTKLGYQSYRFYFKWQYINPKKENEILSYMVKHPLTWWVGTTDGAFDLTVLIWAKNTLELKDFWDGFVNKYQKYIQEKVISVYVGLHDFSYAFFMPEKVLERSTQGILPAEKILLTGTEEKVLEIISENARMPTVEIAKQAGLSAIQVKYAIKQLREKKVILGFRTRINLQKLGLTHYKANFDLKDLENYAEMLEFAKTNPNSIYVDESISYSDFEIELVAQKHAEFLEVMSRFKEKFSDKIKDYNYFIFTKINKINYSPFQKITK
ncbi:MAG: winged helix-turn-helix transcriptional regulator [Candidatus Diapherotrites archaeon]